MRPNARQRAPLLATGVHCSLRDLALLRAGGASIDLATPRSATRATGSGAPSRQRGRGIEFEEVRAYAPGDDVRTIDWRVSARTGRVHTRLFRAERERPVYLLLDQRGPMFFGTRGSMKSVQAAHVAALLAWAALAGGDRVGGIVLGSTGQREIRPRRSRRAVLEFLRVATDANAALGPALPGEPREGNDFSAALASLRRLARPGALLLLVSDFHDWDANCTVQLQLLARHCEVHALEVHDPMERALPAAGTAIFSDGRLRVRVDTSSATLRSAYAAAAGGRLAQLEDAFRSAQARFTPLPTGADAAELLGRCYARRRGT
jgi:uncharacterized protein (DUF58 family)